MLGAVAHRSYLSCNGHRSGRRPCDQRCVRSYPAELEADGFRHALKAGQWRDRREGCSFSSFYSLEATCPRHVRIQAAEPARVGSADPWPSVLLSGLFLLRLEPGNQLMFKPANGSKSETHPGWTRFVEPRRRGVGPVEPGRAGDANKIQSFPQAQDASAGRQGVFHVLP